MLIILCYQCLEVGENLRTLIEKIMGGNTFKAFIKTGFFLALLLMLTSVVSVAQTLPGPADASKIKPFKKEMIKKAKLKSKIEYKDIKAKKAPKGSDEICFLLTEVNISGATAFSDKDLKKLYADRLGREVNLSFVWELADKITKLYKKNGYFLSRAYVPAQEVEAGAVKIKIIEGYVSEVSFDDRDLNDYLIDDVVAKITAKRPLKTTQLESFMLYINSLPGLHFKGFVEPSKNKKTPEAVKLVLKQEKEEKELSVSLDNFGSEYLGPYQMTATYKDSFFAMQDTSISVLTSLPSKELKYLALNHQIPIFPDWSLEFLGSYIKAKPGYTLTPSEIRSSSIQLGVNFNYQPIRQRHENLIFSFGLDGKNTNGDILKNNPLTRDHIRAFRLSMDYEGVDSWNAYNHMSLTYSKGLSILGASDAGDANLSRVEAEPDFTSIKAGYARQQAIARNLVIIGQLSGQMSSAPLFSSEEFGYGGQSFGRAYDSSEISGDHGIAASLEFRYLGLDPWNKMRFTPYVFYDMGKVWNADAGDKGEQASSAGLGVYMNYNQLLTANLGLAWPLSKEIQTPTHGNGKTPRLLLQLSHNFKW